MAKIEIEIIAGPETKGEGKIQVTGLGEFRIGDRVKGNPADLQPLVDLGRARVVEPGE